MLTFRLYLLIAISIMFSMSVSASVVSEKSYTDTSYVVYAGYSGSEVTVSGFKALAELAYIAADRDAPFNGTSIESLDILKPDKQENTFIYTVLKPTKLAVIQNQNFDRVWRI